MNLKLFLESRQRQKDELSRFCHTILSDPNFKGSFESQIAVIGSYRKKKKTLVDQFFKEYKNVRDQIF